MTWPAGIATGGYWARPNLRALRDALRWLGDSASVRPPRHRRAPVEVGVRGAPQPIDLGRLHQADSDQVPYDEVYFSLDRQHVLARALERPGVPDFAVAFYLHSFAEGSPLEAPWGVVHLPPPSWVRPSHL